MSRILLALAVVVACVCVCCADGTNTNHACCSKSVASSSFETNVNVRVVYVRRLCSCGGEMKPGYYVLTSNPPQYPHVCDRCGRSETYLVCYPEVRYEERN